MTTTVTAPSSRGFRFPQEIIAHALWLYFRFNLSFRDVEKLLAARSVCRVLRNGTTVVTEFRVCEPTPSPTCTARRQVVLRRGFLKTNGKRHYLLRAVDQHGNILDILVQSRNKLAAKKFFRKPGALRAKGCTYVPRVLITDKLASSGAAKREVLPSVEHRQSR